VAGREIPSAPLCPMGPVIQTAAIRIRWAIGEDDS
jgi:hypothetical protein